MGVSGESFILGLMTMTPVNIDEKFRNNYIVWTRPPRGPGSRTPRATLPRRVRRRRFRCVRGNADIMKVACMGATLRG